MAHILKIKDENGKWHGVVALKGETPVKGVDYWTEEDKAEIMAYIDELVSSKLQEKIAAKED